MSPEILKLIIYQGAGLVVASLLILVFYKLAVRFGNPFIEAQREQAAAMTQQAASMKDMQKAITEYIQHDNTDHREILLGLQVVIKEVQNLSAAVKVQGEAITNLAVNSSTQPGSVVRIKQ